MRVKALIKLFTPPFILLLFHKIRGENIQFFGPFFSWEKAAQNSFGYDSPQILEKVKTAALAVKNGKAAYERDSVTFDNIEYSWPILACLLYIANVNDGHLNVIDFGGALGSSFFQNRKFFQKLKSLSWNIVEQSQFVACGKECFQTDQLRFFDTVEEANQTVNADVLLISNVLQYLEKPTDILKTIGKMSPRFALIEMVPIGRAASANIFVQEVPKSIYPASYPCWIFNEDIIHAAMRESGYICTEEWVCHLQISNKFIYKGYFYHKTA